MDPSRPIPDAPPTGPTRPVPTHPHPACTSLYWPAIPGPTLPARSRPPFLPGPPSAPGPPLSPCQPGPARPGLPWRFPNSSCHLYACHSQHHIHSMQPAYLTLAAFSLYSAVLSGSSHCAAGLPLLRLAGMQVQRY